MNSRPLTTGELSSGEILCTEGNRLPGFHLKGAFLTLVLLGSGGLAELLLCYLNVQTRIKLLVYILHLLMKVLFCTCR